MPKWYQIANQALNMDPNDLSDVDFFRDLGPFLRLKPENSEYNVLKKKYLNEITEVISPEEIYLLTLSGLVPIEKLHILEQMLPGQPQINPVEQQKLNEEQRINNTHGVRNRRMSKLGEKLMDISSLEESIDRFRKYKRKDSSNQDSDLPDSSQITNSEADNQQKLDSFDLGNLRRLLDEEIVNEESFMISEEESETMEEL